MSISNNEYSKMTQQSSPNSPTLKNCLFAFLIGGTICTLAQLETHFLLKTSLTLDETKAITIITVIFITGLLTGIGVFDKIAKHAGAGTMVPISGFANSIVAPALEFKKEGVVLGIAAQMFSIAGPVIVFGCTSASIYGLIIYILGWY